MPVATFTLLTEETGNDCDYTITVEEIHLGLARLNIEAMSESHDGFNNSQGVDLTAEECEAIGKHLVAASKRLRRSK